MIQAIIPLIADGYDDILLTPQGKKCVLHVFGVIKKCSHIGLVSAFCNHQKLFDLAVSSEIAPSYIEAEGAASLALPERYQPWPASLSIYKDATAVLVLSPRNPLLTVAVVENAIGLIVKNKTVEALTSVVFSIMHPSQLFSGKLVKGKAGDLYLPDQQSYAKSNFFPNVPSLWYRNAEGAVINTITGKQISGRQDFPETVEPDGSFLLLGKKWIESDASPPPYPIHGVKLSPNESILLWNDFDYLRYLAKKKAMSPEITVN